MTKATGKREWEAKQKRAMAELMATLGQIEAKEIGKKEIIGKGLALLDKGLAAKEGNVAENMQVTRLTALVGSLYVAQVAQEYKRGKVKAHNTLKIGEEYMENLARNIDYIGGTLEVGNIYNAEDYSVEIEGEDEIIKNIRVRVDAEELADRVEQQQNRGDWKEEVIEETIGQQLHSKCAEVIKQAEEKKQRLVANQKNSVNAMVMNMLSVGAKKRVVTRVGNDGIDAINELRTALLVFLELVKEVDEEQMGMEWLDLLGLIAGRVTNWAALPLREPDEEEGEEVKQINPEIYKVTEWIYSLMGRITDTTPIEEDIVGEIIEE